MSAIHIDNEFRICVLCGLVYGYRDEDCAGVTPEVRAKAEEDDANYRMHESTNCWCLALEATGEQL